MSVDSPEAGLENVDLSEVVTALRQRFDFCDVAVTDAEVWQLVQSARESAIRIAADATYQFPVIALVQNVQRILFPLSDERLISLLHSRRDY